MTGLWAVVGLCCIDKDFRGRAIAACQGAVQNLYVFLRDENFLVSRAGVETLRASLTKQTIQNAMMNVSNLWEDGCPEGKGQHNAFQYNVTKMGPDPNAP